MRMRIGNWTESLARACARRPWLTIGVWIGIMLLAVFCIVTMLGGALVTDAKFTSEPESIVALNIMDERLGTDSSQYLDEMIIVRSSTLTVDDAEFRTVVEIYLLMFRL